MPQQPEDLVGHDLLAHDGIGILIQPKYIVYEDIVAGRLVPVLDDWDPSPIGQPVCSESTV